MIFIDGDASPPSTAPAPRTTSTAHGISVGSAFANMRQGAPYIIDPERTAAVTASIAGTPRAPSRSTKSIKVTIEHGHANHRADNFYSVAYWYQTEPHAEFPALPPPEARVPKVTVTG